ncbi:MAG: glycosyltransferase family 39 protein [Thermoflexales bacterium]|nr:glycosyltransferase family 39 protein [Thermoflexales bacterium]
MKKWRRIHLFVIYGLVWLSFGLRAATLDRQSMWRDEVDALCYAFEFPHATAQAIAPGAFQALELPSACPPLELSPESGQSRLWRLVQTLQLAVRHNGPLYYFLLRAWIALVGYSVYALRFFSLLSGVLAVPLVYVLGLRLSVTTKAGSPGTIPVGVWGAVCTALSPYLVWYSQETKMYALLLALVVLAVYALRRAIEEGGAWWIVMVIATSLGVYIHILAALLILVEFAMLLVWHPCSRRNWVEALISFACLTLPYLPLVGWQLPALLQPVGQTGYPDYPFREIVYILIYGFSTGAVAHPRGWILVLPLLSLGMAGLLFGRAHWQHRGALAIWIGLPILAMYAIARLRGPMFTDRYLIWIGPAVYLLVALGVHFLWRQSHLLALMVVIPLLISLGHGLQAQTSGPIKSDFRATARFVEQRAEASDLMVFQIPHARYTFDYYYGPTFNWIDGLYTNAGMTDEQVDKHMQALIGKRRGVWLIASEQRMWDEQLHVFQWLETHAGRTDEDHFTLVDVYRYQLP